MSISFPSMFSLAGRTALITGGTRGIGAALTLALARAGADIVLVQRDDKDTDTRDAVVSLGRRATIFTADMSSAETVSSLVKAVLDAGHDISILIPCAGIQRRQPAESFPQQDWDDILQVNLTAVFTLCRDVGAHMLTRTPSSSGLRGNIINIASLTTFQGSFNIVAYAAAKGGIGQLTKALSNEWSGRGVNVNAIAPGYVQTQLTEALTTDESRSKELLSRIPAGRWGKPEDFEGVAIFLAGEASRYVCGEIITVDGGWMGR